MYNEWVWEILSQQGICDKIHSETYILKKALEVTHQWVALENPVDNSLAPNATYTHPHTLIAILICFSTRLKSVYRKYHIPEIYTVILTWGKVLSDEFWWVFFEIVICWVVLMSVPNRRILLCAWCGVIKRILLFYVCIIRHSIGNGSQLCCSYTTWG